MGTSTSQRSPATPEWDSVRELYRDGAGDPNEISRRIVRAIGPKLRAEMAGPGVSVCLGTLLGGAEMAAQNPPAGVLAGADTVLAAAGQLRRRAERTIAAQRFASRFSDIALDALGTSAIRASAGASAATSLSAVSTMPIDGLASFYQQDRLHDLAARFLGDDVGQCFRYFVSRDIWEYVGTDALATVDVAKSFTDEVAGHCASICGGLPLREHEGRLRAALGAASPRERMAIMAQVMAHALEQGLGAIAGSAHAGTSTRPRARADRSDAGAEEEDQPAGRDGSQVGRLIADHERQSDVAYMPVYSLQAAAGYFGSGEDVRELGYVETPARLLSRSGLFAAQIAGRSMEPRIPDGSLAVFRAPVVGSRQGKTVLAQKRGYADPDTGGSYTVKRYESTKRVSEDGWEHSSIQLVPENPSYDVIEIAAEEAEDLAVIAEFVGLLEE